MRSVARETGFGSRTIRKWLKCTAPPERRASAPKPCSPHYFFDFLSRRWAEGCVRGRQLFQEIKLRDYTGKDIIIYFRTTWRLDFPGSYAGTLHCEISGRFSGFELLGIGR